MIHFQAHQIIGQRASQQDYFAHTPISGNGQLFVLADGMGGHQGGEIASQTATQAFLQYFAYPIADETPADALHTALLRANAAVHQCVLQYPELQGMGTTLLAVWFAENGDFYYISVGDSPLYHAVSGSLKRINANHAFATELQEWVAAGKITAEAAAQHPQRHAITSALTGDAIAHIDQNSGSLKHNERLLLASDGIHTLPDEHIAQILSNTPLHIALHALFRTIESQQQPHQDNTTLILLEYNHQNTHELMSPATLIPPDVAFRQPENTENKPLNPMGKYLGLGVSLVMVFGVMILFVLLKNDEPNQPIPMQVEQVEQAVSAPEPQMEIKAVSAASAASN